MKCIWRILLGVVTAGISEVIRHRNCKKNECVLDFAPKIVLVGDLTVGDIFMYNGRIYSWQGVDAFDLVSREEVPIKLADYVTLLVDQA